MAPREVERFDRVVLPHLDDAYALARYLMRNEHDAQDVVQDAVLRALRYFDGLRGFRNGDARAWLLAIVRNCCHTWRRREHFGSNDSVALSDALHLPDMRESVAADALAIQSSERTRIEHALAELPLEFREVIVLRELNDLSYQEISTVTGVPIGTVMSRLARARKRLASLLGVQAQEAS